jgi:hypothetical protein
MNQTLLTELHERACRLCELSEQLLKLESQQLATGAGEAIETCRQSMQVAVLMLEQVLSGGTTNPPDFAT